MLIGVINKSDCCSHTVLFDFLAYMLVCNIFAVVLMRKGFKFRLLNMVKAVGGNIDWGFRECKLLIVQKVLDW